MYDNTLKAASGLLGNLIIHKTKDGTIKATITETEAYLEDDPASHSFNKRTDRNAMMFNRPKTAYVYRIYGKHLCFNVVTNKLHTGEAVLIRAIEPIEGHAIIKKNRNGKTSTDGPAKLTQALGITMAHNDHDLSNHLTT